MTEREGPARIWISHGGHLRPGEKNWLFIRGGDEYNNGTLGVRISPTRYLMVCTTIPLRRTLLMDDEIDDDDNYW